MRTNGMVQALTWNWDAEMESLKLTVELAEVGMGMDFRPGVPTASAYLKYAARHLKRLRDIAAQMNPQEATR